MIETLQTLKQFQRDTGRVLIAEGIKQPIKAIPAAILPRCPTCPVCEARKAKALARVKRHRAKANALKP